MIPVLEGVINRKKITFHINGKKHLRIECTLMNYNHLTDEELYALAKKLKIKTLKPVVSFNILALQLGVTRDEYVGKNEMYEDMILDTPYWCKENRENVFEFIHAVGGYSMEEIQECWNESFCIRKLFADRIAEIEKN